MALWRIRATVDDRPGYLSVLTASLALRSVNILAVQVHTTEAGAVDDFLVDAPETLTERDLTAAVERGRGRDPWVARAEAQALADLPTRALALAGRLVRDPDGLGAALASLLGAGSVTWRPHSARARPGFDGATMRLSDPSGGAFEVARDAPAFTPAEYARAQALVEVAAAAQRQAVESVALVLPGGVEVLLRPATGEDLAAVRQMHLRCSAATRQGRFLTGPALPSDSRLHRLLEPTGGVTLLAQPTGTLTGGAAGQVVATATLVTEGPVGQAALLVEDAWQRRGLGGALARRLMASAARCGLQAVVGSGPCADPGLERLLARVAPQATVEEDGQLRTVTVPVPGPGAPAPTGSPTTRS
ncbi:MAG TPA: GNAT family N-acetyltransferase [Catenuloplanes sp.]